MKRRQGYFGVLVLAALLVVAAGCSREAKQKSAVQTVTPAGTFIAIPASQASDQNKALVRLVNAIPGGQPIDGFVGDQKAFDSVAPENVSPYKEVDKGKFTVRIQPSGAAEMKPLAENSQGFTAGHHYTLIAMVSGSQQTKAAGNANNPNAGENPTQSPNPDQTSQQSMSPPNQIALKIIDDNLVPPSKDKAKIRLINADPRIAQVSLWEVPGPSMSAKGQALSTGQGNEPIAGTQAENQQNANRAQPRGLQGQQATEEQSQQNEANQNQQNAENQQGATTPKQDLSKVPGAKKLLSGVNFDKVAGYKQVNPATVNLEVVPAKTAGGNANQAARNAVAEATAAILPATTLDPGKIYTFIVTGQPNTDQLRTITIQDQFVQGAPTTK